MWAACVSHCPGDGHPRQQARRGWRQREKGARPPTHLLRTSLRAPLWAPSCDLRVWPVGPSQAPARDSAQIIVCLSCLPPLQLLLSHECVHGPGAPGCCCLRCRRSRLPRAGVLLRRRSPSGPLPLPFRLGGWALPPCHPLPPQAWSLLGWTEAQSPQLSPPTSSPLQAREAVGEELCLVFCLHVVLGVFLVVSWIPIKMKEIASSTLRPGWFCPGARRVTICRLPSVRNVYFQHFGELLCSSIN